LGLPPGFDGRAGAVCVDGLSPIFIHAYQSNVQRYFRLNRAARWILLPDTEGNARNDIEKKGVIQERREI
jgi:hypothetical protein